MKKILLPLVLFLMLSGVVFGQTSANRTAVTKVSDALALLPASDPQEYDRLMTELLSTGSEGVAMLTEMFTTTNNAPVSYALSGCAAYVTKPGNDGARRIFNTGIVSALENSRDPEIKAFYIRLLQQSGADDVVPVIAKYVADKQLGNPALAALVAIGTPQAIEVIATAVKAGSGDKTALAKAVGDIGATSVESTLISWLPAAAGDQNLTKAIFYALSKTGSINNALPLLRTAAQRANYTAENTQANESYLALMSYLASKGHGDAIAKEAGKLTKKKTIPTHTRIAAFDIYVDLMNWAAMPVILKVMDDPSRIYRNGVLNATEPLFSKSFYLALMNKMLKVKTTEAKVDIINFVALSGDPSFVPLITPYIGTPVQELNIASMWAVTRLGGEGIPALLVGEMKKEGASQAVVDVARDCLLSYWGHVNDQAASAVESGSDAGKIAGLSVLSSRKAVAQANIVIEATKSSNPEVAMAAYNALKNVSSVTDLPTLYTMLESADNSKVSALQQAIIAALSTQSKEKQKDAITYQMLKAGNKKPLYYVVLANTGALGVLDVIVKDYDAANQNEKDQIVKALTTWKGMEAADYLYKIAESDKSDQALRGYISLASKSPITQELKLIMLSDAMEITAESVQQALILREVNKLRTFQALMFAGKYLDSSNADVKQQAALAVMNIALANKDYYGPVVRDLLTKTANVITGGDSNYQKEAIRKHLAEMPAEGGYVSMFNGKDLTGWKGLVENPIKRAKMSTQELAEKQKKADEIMRREWTVQNGVLVFDGKAYDNICTEKQYGNFEMYLDWMLYPDGKDADAGVYLRGSPQVQMWDTARCNVGAQVGSGGLYNNKVHPSAPTKVADNKLGHWNTFYIKMIGDRVTVILNGEKVVDNVILENYWDRSQPIFPIEQIELQAHGTRVAYRELYINELPMVEPFKLSAKEEKEGYSALFDGTNMHQWVGNTQDYVAEDGAIVLYPTRGGGGNLYTKKEYGDFVFRFEFMLTPGANNGLGIRTPMEGDTAYVGMELQILDDDAPIYSKLEEYQYHGSVYGVIPAKRGALKPMGEWNYEEVYIKGNNIKITLNGIVIVDGNLAEAAKNGTIDGKNHPGLLNKSGHIAFLGHGSVVKFRNIRVKELK